MRYTLKFCLQMALALFCLQAANPLIAQQLQASPMRQDAIVDGTNGRLAADIPAASQQAATAQAGQTATTPTPSRGTGEPQTSRQSSGSISGTIVDQGGAVVVGATVRLTLKDQAEKHDVLSGDNGQFSFSNIAAGPFQVTVSAPDFETKLVSGIVNEGQAFIVPSIVLTVAATTTNVNVGLSEAEVAQEEVKEQEKQRVLGIFPNFYTTYVPDPAPLGPKQKFSLAWKSVTDPISIAGVGFLAGLYQAGDELSGYGQGAAGYGRRFGALYGDVFFGTFIDSAILPSLLKQDPRYFYKGTGTTKSRILYALRNAVICKGDNKQWQLNYSTIIGSFATAGISYTYYPASDRSGTLLVETALIRIAEGSVAGLFQEFVIPHLTPRLKSHPPPPQQP
jgi:Carboxypeptidase regulatory-like domain